MKTLQGCYFTKLRLWTLTIYTRAIALSLQEANRKPGLIELDSDDDDEEAQFQKDLKRAMQKSSAETSQSGSHPAIASASSQQPDRPAESATNAFLSERAQLERERRERQKRLRPSSRKSTEDEESDDEGPPAKRHQVSTSSSRLRSNVSSSSKILGSTSTPTIEQTFWNGELRQTATQHAEPRKDGQPVFRLTEVLGKVYLS
jgi:tyrosyl-DNA phosphodiesterase-1